MDGGRVDVGENTERGDEGAAGLGPGCLSV